MNIDRNINKLLYALNQKGNLYKINTFKYYNEDLNKYSTKYQVLKRIFIQIDEEQEEKYNVDYDCYSKIDLIKYLIKEYKGSEANGV